MRINSRKVCYPAFALKFIMVLSFCQITMVIEAMYILSTGLTKISILLFYRRLSNGAVSTTFHYTVLGCIAFVIGYIITFLFTLFLGCSPINSYWLQVSIPWVLAPHVEGVDYHCFNEAANLMSASAISILQDFIACGMPMLLFWKLQMPRRQKIALGAIFGVGFLSVSPFSLCSQTNAKNLTVSASPASCASFLFT
jgi:hypothetical protein